MGPFRVCTQRNAYACFSRRSASAFCSSLAFGQHFAKRLTGPANIADVHEGLGQLEHGVDLLAWIGQTEIATYLVASRVAYNGLAVQALRRIG
jgi:hypothetical protein